MAKHNQYAAHNRNSKDLKYDLTSQKRTSLNQHNDHLNVRVYVQIRLGHFLQAQSSRHSQTRTETQLVLRRTRTNNHSKPFRNQIYFVGDRSHCWMTTIISTIPASWSFLLQERCQEMMLAKYNDHHPSSITDRSLRKKKLCKPRWVEPDLNYNLLLVII